MTNLSIARPMTLSDATLAEVTGGVCTGKTGAWIANGPYTFGHDVGPFRTRKKCREWYGWISDEKD